MAPNTGIALVPVMAALPNRPIFLNTPPPLLPPNKNLPTPLAALTTFLTPGILLSKVPKLPNLFTIPSFNDVRPLTTAVLISTIFAAKEGNLFARLPITLSFIPTTADLTAPVAAVALAPIRPHSDWFLPNVSELSLLHANVLSTYGLGTLNVWTSEESVVGVYGCTGGNNCCSSAEFANDFYTNGTGSWSISVNRKMPGGPPGPCQGWGDRPVIAFRQF